MPTIKQHKGQELGLSPAQVKIINLARAVSRLAGIDWTVSLSETNAKRLASLGWTGPKRTADAISGARAAIMAKLDTLPALIAGDLASEAIHASAKEVRASLSAAILALRPAPVAQEASAA